VDFLERWFGVSPDGGSGAVEVLIFVVLFAAVLVLARRRLQRQRRRL
jgi:uncharacterized membrane protein